MDIFYRREETRVGGDFRQYPERFRVERARFIVAIPFITYVVFPLLTCLKSKRQTGWWCAEDDTSKRTND